MKNVSQLEMSSGNYYWGWREAEHCSQASGKQGLNKDGFGVLGTYLTHSLILFACLKLSARPRRATYQESPVSDMLGTVPEHMYWLEYYQFQVFYKVM